MPVSGSSALIATALSQLRNAYISCMINKNDPYNATTCLYNMLAMLPEESRPNIDDLDDGTADKADWIEDPEESKAMEKTWIYFRKLSYKVEESVAKYVANVQTRRQF